MHVRYTKKDNEQLEEFFAAVRNLPKAKRAEFFDELTNASEAYREAIEALSTDYLGDADVRTAFEGYASLKALAGYDIEGDLLFHAQISDEDSFIGEGEDEDEADLIEDGGSPTPEPDFIEDDRPTA